MVTNVLPPSSVQGASAASTDHAIDAGTQNSPEPEAPSAPAVQGPARTEGPGRALPGWVGNAKALLRKMAACGTRAAHQGKHAATSILVCGSRHAGNDAASEVIAARRAVPSSAPALDFGSASTGAGIPRTHMAGAATAEHAADAEHATAAPQAPVRSSTPVVLNMEVERRESAPPLSLAASAAAAGVEDTLPRATPEQIDFLKSFHLPIDPADMVKALHPLSLELLRMPLISIDDLAPGDILFAYEVYPKTAAHAKTQSFQYPESEPDLGRPGLDDKDKRPRLNGRVNDKTMIGDYRNVHALIAVPGMGADGTVQVVDARGGIGTKTPIFRVQATAIQSGTYKVFRHADREVASIAAWIALLWASEHNVAYSVRQLSEMGKPRPFYEFCEDDLPQEVRDMPDGERKRSRIEEARQRWEAGRKEEAVRAAMNAFDPDPEMYRNPVEPVLKPNQTLDDAWRDLNGVMCTNLVAVAFQAAAVQEPVQRKMLESLETAARISEPEKRALFLQEVEGFEGLLQLRARGLSPKFLEGYMLTAAFTDSDGNPKKQFEPVGRLAVGTPAKLEETPPHAPNLALAAVTGKPLRKDLAEALEKKKGSAAAAEVAPLEGERVDARKIEDNIGISPPASPQAGPPR